MSRKAQSLARRRRGRRFNRYVIALGGLAAALLLLVLAYRVQWNPLPVLALVGVMALLLHMPGKVYGELTRFLTDVSPVDPREWARTRWWGKEDPFLVVIETEEQRAQMTLDLDEIRSMFVPVDGSDRRPDFNREFNPMRLPVWLRLVLLPDLCGLNVGGVRRWRVRIGRPGNNDTAYPWTGPEGMYWATEGTYITFEPLNTAPELVRWTKAYLQIRYLLGFDVCFEYLEGSGAVNLRVLAEEMPGEFRQWLPDTLMRVADDEDEQETRDMLPYEPLPFVPEVHPVGHLAEGWLYFGEQFVDRTKGGHWLKIADMTHFLVMGTSGFGKSVFLNQMLQGVAFNRGMFDQVVLVDLKGGVELWPYQALGEQFRVVYRLDDLPALVAGLVQAIEGRLEEMREKGWRNWQGGKTLLVIDEYAQIQLSPEGTKEERQRKQAMLADLNKISMLGRAAGVLIWAQLQKGTSDVMDSSFRANLASQVCFKVPNKLTAAGMFGSTDELMVDPVKLPKGRFVLFDASKGETHYLQARVIPA